MSGTLGVHATDEGEKYLIGVATLGPDAGVWVTIPFPTGLFDKNDDVVVVVGVQNQGKSDSFGAVRIRETTGNVSVGCDFCYEF